MLVEVNFRQAEGRCMMGLSVDGKAILLDVQPAVLAGALHAIAAETVHFKSESAEHSENVRASYPFHMRDAFRLVEKMTGFDVTLMVKLVHASIQLHQSPSQAARLAAIDSWSIAESSLPPDLVINSAVHAK